MALPAPPDWLGQWEEQSMCNFGRHPEARADEAIPCPQCNHKRHSGKCQHRLVASGESLCHCPGINWQPRQ